MKFLVECTTLGGYDPEVVIKGLTAYAQLFDGGVQVKQLKDSDKTKSEEMFFLKALEVVSDELLKVKKDLKEHTAIGNPQHVEVE